MSLNNNNIDHISESMEKIADGFGFCCFWRTQSFRHTPFQLKDMARASGFSQTILDSFSEHSLKASIGLAKYDSQWKKIKFNNHNIEAKTVHVDDSTGAITVEFLGYEKITDQEGKRTQVDSIVFDSYGNLLKTGVTDASREFVRAVDHHMHFWGNNDIYDKVTKPMLKSMDALRISSSNYYVMKSPSNIEKIDKLKNFLSMIGYEFFTLTQAKDKQTQSALSAQVQDALASRISDAEAKVKKWNSQNRVHGRSESAMLTELHDILQLAEELERNLGSDLKGIKEMTANVRNEAKSIIHSQSPAGMNTMAYNYFKTMVEDDNNIAQKESYGNTYYVKVGDDNQEFIINDSLRADAKKVVESLGFYAVVAVGCIVLKPLKSLDTLSVDI